MPHLVVEYSANCPDQPDFQEIFDGMHTTLVELGICPLTAIKSRVHRLEEFRVANGSKQNVFVHLSVALLPGRSAESKSQLAQSLFAKLKSGFPRTLAESPHSVTLEIRELDGSSYQKQSNF